MPKKSVPAYRLHKPSGQARTIIDGRHVYLGKYNSAESRQKYARLLAGVETPAVSGSPEPSNNPTVVLLVSELLVKYLEFAQMYYSSEGKPTKEYRAMVDAVAHVNDLYSDLRADNFGPLKLKSIREYLIDRGLCRTEINKRIRRIIRIFKWAVSEELIPSSVHEGLRTVTGLRYGRTEARESEPVKPVSQQHVELTLPHVSPQIAAMIQVQLLTGMRPAEVTRMKLDSIDRSDEVWIYEPENHKNRWRGHCRQIPLGPKAQQILQPFLQRPVTQFFFSPAESEAWRNAQRAVNRNRTTPIYPCELRQREKRHRAALARKSKRPRSDQYCPDSYRRAIEYGVRKANQLLLVNDPNAKKIPTWTPYQLRHSFATEMRRKHGVEAAQLGLGHKQTNIVDVYAEKNLRLLVELAKQNG
jgi:integrase